VARPQIIGNLERHRGFSTGRRNSDSLRSGSTDGHNWIAIYDRFGLDALLGPGKGGRRNRLMNPEKKKNFGIMPLPKNQSRRAVTLRGV
jgi:hypothetical protein